MAMKRRTARGIALALSLACVCASAGVRLHLATDERYCVVVPDGFLVQLNNDNEMALCVGTARDCKTSIYAIPSKRTIRIEIGKPQSLAALGLTPSEWVAAHAPRPQRLSHQESRRVSSATDVYVFYEVFSNAPYDLPVIVILAVDKEAGTIFSVIGDRDMLSKAAIREAIISVALSLARCR